MNKLKLVFVFFVALICFSCSHYYIDTKSNTISLNISREALNIPNGELGIVCNLSGAINLKKELTIKETENEAQITFADIPVGKELKIEVQVYNNSNYCFYTGDVTTTLLNENDNSVSIDLKPKGVTFELLYSDVTEQDGKKYEGKASVSFTFYADSTAIFTQTNCLYNITDSIVLEEDTTILLGTYTGNLEVGSELLFTAKQMIKNEEVEDIGERQQPPMRILLKDEKTIDVDDFDEFTLKSE